MRAKRPPGRVSRVCRYAAMVAVSAVGFALVLFVRQSLQVSFTALPVARQNSMAINARGGGRARGWQQSVNYVRPVIASSAITVVLDPQATLSATMQNDFTALPIWTPIEAATVDRASIPQRDEVIVYNVQPGDNLWLIAQRFGLDQDTLVWANAKLEEDPDLLRIGQEIYVLPVDGVWHTVQADEMLAGIAERYKVDPQKIIDYALNGIGGDGAVQAGQKLIIPGGVRPPRPRPTASQPKAAISSNRLIIPAGAPDTPVEAPAQPGRFIWPAQGIITQGYHKWHGAIDIANNLGTPLLAADAGTVTFAAVSGGLGNAIQIDHGDGFVTTYGHLDSIAVQVGQSVQKGEEIGKMGTTGHSTGPHLHLIFLYNGGIINPMNYLPQ